MQYCKIPIIPTYLCIEGKIMLNETYLDVQCTIHFVSVYNEHVLSLCCDWLNPESRDPCLEDLRTNNKVDITVVDHLSWVGCRVSYPVHTVKWRNHFRTNKIQLYIYVPTCLPQYLCLPFSLYLCLCKLLIILIG